jgi:serine/threonine protein kinase
MKTLDKWEMQERNKVQRVLTEESILAVIDHPFLATCYCSLQTDSHLHFVMEYCEGGELYGLLNAQPRKRLKVGPRFQGLHSDWRLAMGYCQATVRQPAVAGSGSFRRLWWAAA